jgi:hypothetical protein
LNDCSFFSAPQLKRDPLGSSTGLSKETMLCSNCRQREARYDHFGIGARCGAFCEECALELGARFLQETGVDLQGLSHQQAAEGMLQRAKQISEVLRQNPPTTDPDEIARRLRKGTSGSGEGAA